MTIETLNTYTGIKTVTVNAKIMCGPNLESAKSRNGAKEPFQINGQTYYIITSVYGL